MNIAMKTGIHIFRKDLRVYDNLALSQLSKQVDRIVGVFIFDPKQIKKTSANENHYSVHAAQFIIDCVNDLNQQCDGKLLVAYGNSTSAMDELIQLIKPTHVSFNADFTQYALKRDDDLIKLCERKDVATIVNEDDQSLTAMNDMLKKDGTPYMVYGTFFKNLQKQKINKPVSLKINWFKPKYSNSDVLKWKLVEPTWEGGREEALHRLKIRTAVGATDKVADETSQLSAYLNQGCLSIREVYWVFKQRYKSIEPIRSIAWRDFFLCIFRFHPRGNSYDSFIDERYGKLKWPKVKETEWKRFMNCETGFVLVDAAMKELLETGFTNNRSRLILGTFWIKYLLINPLDPEYGSQAWFSKLLIDCNASQNALNHKWVIGDLDLSGRRFAMKGTHPLTGRSMRIDNEMVKRYDPQFVLIKKWLPQFADKDLKECKAELKKIKPMYEWRDRYSQYAKLFKGL